MKYIFTLFIAFLVFQSSFGQEIGEMPININPILVEKNWKSEEAKAKRIKATETYFFDEDDRGGKGNFEDTLYIVSGEKLVLKVDTFGIGSDTMIVAGNFKNCTAKNKYNVVDIIGNQGVKIGFDTLLLLFPKKSKKTDTICYWLVTKRADKTIKQSVTYLKALKDTVVCMSFKDFPGKVKTVTLSDCDNRDIARELRKNKTALDSCIYYAASRLGGVDTVCIKVCDEYGICDNFILPFKVLQDTLNTNESLTFFDDFSYNRYYPNGKLWLDDRVFINNTMASLPVTAGVATFDGLNYNGRPYSGGQGVADILTSAYLDFSSKPNMHLSFYVQEKGLGFGPDKNDYFSVEFKDKNDRWIELKQDTLQGALIPASAAAPNFKFRSVVIPNEYMYKGFQFRFVARGSRTGINDVWNLDYVRISDFAPFSIVNNKKEALPFADMAFVASPPRLLKNYTAMPWQQFKGFEQAELNTTTDFTINNLFGKIENITIANLKIKETKSNATLLDGYNFVQKLNINPNFSSETIPFNTVAKDAFNNNLTALPASKEMDFVSEYSLACPEQNKVYKGINQNDTIRSNTRISNFYAYDDGTPESIIFAQGVETQVAVKFTTNVKDILRGVFINFPYFNTNVEKQKFNLRIYIGTLSDKPAYERLFLTPKYNTDAVNGFTYFELVDKDAKPVKLEIPKGDFYVAWQQLTNVQEPIAVGFDKNNPQAAKYNFGNTNGNWKSLATTAKGAVLLRPVLMQDGAVTSAKENTNNFDFELYPNPTSNELIVNTFAQIFNNATYQIFDLAGKKWQSNILENTINVENLPNGVYLLQIRAGEKMKVKKFVVLK